MHIIDLLYLAFITVALCIGYFILLRLFPYFFGQNVPPQRRSPWFPLAYIVTFSALVYAVNFSLPDPELANRILHVFGGGFLGFSVCFLAARDSGVRISKFQFFLFSTLIVLALGTANELLEFFLQEYAGLISATSVTDTWLDLSSNVVGAILASMCLVPLHK